MAVTQFDLTSLYDLAFGVRGVPFQSKELYDKKIVQIADGEDFQSPTTSSTDTGEFIRVQKLLNARLPSGADVFAPIQIGDFILPNEPTISISVKKNIIETMLHHKPKRIFINDFIGQAISDYKRATSKDYEGGTVKEFLGFQDYEIVIRGVVINAASHKIYPETIVEKLNKLFQKNESLPIICGLTALLGIERIVMKELRFPEMTGVQHAQAYEITCVSDAPFLVERA